LALPPITSVDAQIATFIYTEGNTESINPILSRKVTFQKLTERFVPIVGSRLEINLENLMRLRLREFARVTHIIDDQEGQDFMNSYYTGNMYGAKFLEAVGMRTV
jgi:hypothetical protein